VREPNWVQEAPDLIEAYVRAGRHTEATERLSDLQRKAERAERVWALAAAARCRGLLADDVVFEREFEEALAYHDRTPTPFERARTELCFGERLRRARRPSDARLHLRSALEMFDRLDAAPWTARARSELEASGENVRPRGDGGLRSLTPQELQLALIVGRGATNKEASAAFFVSPKTVEAHLHHIYVKLSIRSRTELARISCPRANARLNHASSLAFGGLGDGQEANAQSAASAIPWVQELVGVVAACGCTAMSPLRCPCSQQSVRTVCVQACLRRLHFAAVRCSHEPPDLQHVSVLRS
jgi:DNA-binding CsgD family transcriptional regulator